MLRFGAGEAMAGRTDAQRSRLHGEAEFFDEFSVFETPEQNDEVGGGAGEDGLGRMISEGGDEAVGGAEIAPHGERSSVADADAFVFAAFRDTAAIG